MTMGDSCVSGLGKYPGDCEFTQALLQKAASRNPPQERGFVWQSLFAKVKPLKLLLLDVDGVLTDGSISYTDQGHEIKTFNAKDGFGLNLLRKAGLDVGIITARNSVALERRCQDLRINHLYQGQRNKVVAYREILAKLALQNEQVAYMGDDWLDLPLLQQVGFAVAPADCSYEIKGLVDFVTKKKGGKGAVRELCDLIIDGQGLTEQLLSEYLQRS